MIERHDGPLFEDPSPFVQEKFNRYIRMQEEEFSQGDSQYRIEAENLFSTVCTDDEVIRTFYRNTGTLENPTFRVKQKLSIQQQDILTFMHIENFPESIFTKEEFGLTLSDNHIQSINFDSLWQQRSLGITYSPQQILSVQIMDESMEDSLYNERLESSCLHVTDALLHSKKPTHVFLNDDRYVLLASPEMLHIIRSGKRRDGDELSVPTFINGERIVHSLSLQTFLSGTKKSFELPSSTDIWQLPNYSDYLHIEWIPR